MRLRDSLEAVAEISREAFEDLRRDIDPNRTDECLFSISAEHWAHKSARTHG